MDGKRFVFDLQRFAAVTVTKNEENGTPKYTVDTGGNAKTITETTNEGTKTYEIGDDSTNTYNSLEDAVAAADSSIRFIVTKSNTENDNTITTTITGYTAADDFKKDYLTTTESGASITAINIYGDVTLQENITNDDKVTCTITVKKTATLNLSTHKLNIETPATLSGNSDSGIVINDGATLTVDADTGGEINYTTSKISADRATYSDNSDNTSTVGGYIENTVKGARQVAAIKVGDSTKQQGTTAKLIVNGGTIKSNSTAICAGNGTEVTINTGATVESTYSCGIYVGNVNGREKNTAQNIDDDITLNISGGTVRSAETSSLPAIQVSGTLSTNTTTINITGGTVKYANQNTKFKADGKSYGNPDAIYAGGKVDINMTSGTVTSGGTGIELRAGNLNVTGGTITSTASDYKVNTNSSASSGGQTYGAAIAMSQHTTGKAVTAKVSAGEVSGQVALAIENPVSKAATAESTISAEITGGTFESKGTGATAIAAKATDSRSKININGKVTFIGTVENTVTDANTTTPSITFGDEAEVTVVTVLERDSDGNITKQEKETYNSTSIQYTETWTETSEDGNSTSKTETYPVNDEAWNKSKEDPAKKFYYLVANTVKDQATGETSKSQIAGAKAVLAPKKEGESGPETDSTDTLALTTGLKDQESYDEVIALDLNDTLFSSLFDETSKFKTLDASAIKQVSTTTGEGENAVTTKTDRLKLNITGNANIESIVGSEGNDTLTAGSVGSALDGGKGDDLLIGGSGPDTFLFSEAGNGSDSIQGYETSDTVSLGSGLTPATSFDKVSYAGSDYVVSLGDSTTDSLTFKSTEKFVLQKTENDKVITYSYAPGSIVSGEGVTIGSSYYKSKTFNGNSGDNAVFKTIDGSAVEHAIRITGNSNANSITGSKYGGTLLGGDANDTLVATSVGTYLNGGDEDDSLVGYDGGGNVFIYTGGDDKIVHYTTEGTNKAQDLVSVASGINVTSATVTTTETNNADLLLDFGDGDKLTFKSGGGSTISLKSGKKYYTFSASSIASAADKSITLTANFNSSYFDAGDTYNTVDAHLVNKGAISIKGNSEANYIIGGSSGGSLSGLAGNDTLVGGKGNDTFHYTEGKDVIVGFNEGGTDLLSIDNPDTEIAKAKASSRKLTFTMSNKANTLVFRATDAAPTQISLSSNEGYLTKDGVVSLPSSTKSLKLFSSAKGRIDLNNDTLYSGKEIASVSAAAVEKQSVTLVGGSNQNATFTFAAGNKKRDGFEYNGGKVTIGNYESGKDRLNLGDFTISGFEVKAAEDQTAGDVVISLGSADNVISLTGAAGSEMLIHQATNRGNSYSKMVFSETGVVYDKAKTKATNATIWGGMTERTGYDATSATKLKKIKVRDDSVTGISIQAGGNNTLIDASAAGEGISLYSGDKNDKFIGSGEADMFVYTKGKDIIQNFGDGDQILLKGTGTELALTDAKITSGKKSIKFKFEGGNKNTLTIKPIKNETLSGSLKINSEERTYGKNFIASDANVSLTSQFGGTYNIAKSKGSTIDGHLVSKKLTFKGTDAAESLVGGQNKTTFKGGGGADSLVGGKGADTFFYAKGDTVTAAIANFDFDNDKLKIAGGTINKIESLEGSDGGIQFAMKNGRGDSPAVGWFKLTSSATSTNYDENGKATSTGTAIAAKDVLIKANNTYYWFAQGGETLASDSLQSAKIGDLITWDKKISASQAKNTNCDIIELNYSTNLVKAGVASVVSSSNQLPTKS